MANKYPPAGRDRGKDGPPKKTISPGSTPEHLKAWIDTEGTLEVENIKERDSLGLSLEFNDAAGQYYFSKELDDNTKEEYVSDRIFKQYRTNVTRSFEVKQAFAVYQSEVKEFITEYLPRYTSLPAAHKKEIRSLKVEKNSYLFTQERFGNFWNQIFIDSTIFGPYNYDTKLEVTKDITQINDLIVITTGNRWGAWDKQQSKVTYLPSGQRIVWVSPHELLNYSGAGNYLSTGYISTWHQVTGGLRSGANFKTIDFGVTNNHGAYALSSKFVSLYAGDQIKTVMPYGFLDETNADYFPKTNQFGLSVAPFYYVYNEYRSGGTQNRGGMETEDWDGIVPSGATVSIQTWSTNPKYIGFNGEISIKPVDSSVAEDCSMSSTETGEGVSIDYQSSIRQAINGAKRKFYKKLNKYLMDKGIKYKNKKKIKYDRMLERVAQNVYDGLTVLRNDQLAKLQTQRVGDPENSPIYYDGTSNVYGGSLDKANYDYLFTPVSRMYTGVSTSTSNTTAGGGSSSSSSSNAGGSTSGY